MITPRDDGWDWYTHGVQLYTAMIRSGTPFAQANYGDGEWACLLGHEGQNVNGETYEPELRDALRETLLKPSGMWHGWNPSRKLENEAKAWCEANGVDVPWVYKETLSAANVNGALGPFFRALRERDVILVAGPHLAVVNLSLYVTGHRLFMPVSESRAWTEVGYAVDVVSGKAEENSVVLFAAGMGSNLMIHECRKRSKDWTLIDIGACLDPYVGVYSRKGYRTKTFQDEMMARNLS